MAEYVVQIWSHIGSGPFHNGWHDVYCFGTAEEAEAAAGEDAKQSGADHRVICRELREVETAFFRGE